MKHLLVYHDGYVKIEYQHAGTRTRISTGVAIPSKAYLKANNELKSTINEHKSKQKIINSLYKKAGEIITNHVQKFQAQPTGEQFKIAWREYDKQVKDSKYLMEYYDKFYTFKVNEFNREKYNSKSIKDYTNIKYYLEDYITYTNTPIRMDDISRDWMNKFVGFMETERKDYDKSRKVGGKYWSKGKLVGSTVKKRIALFLGFLNWLDDEQLFPMPKGLKKYYGTLDDSETVKAAITKEEANRLYKHNFNDEKSDFIKDIFVFACFTGMRWEDICSFNDKDIKDSDVGLIIEKKAKKTKGVFRVPINNIVNEIIQRYDHNLYRYDNANFNKYLKLLLAETDWFSDETKFLDDDGNYKKRWQCLSIHRGRDSFITMLLNDRVPINQIMKYTGHVTVSSLNMYIDLKSEIENHTNTLVI